MSPIHIPSTGARRPGGMGKVHLLPLPTGATRCGLDAEEMTERPELGQTATVDFCKRCWPSGDVPGGDPRVTSEEEAIAVGWLRPD